MNSSYDSGTESKGDFKTKLIDILKKYGIFIVLLAIILIISIFSPIFFTTRNLLNILRQISVIGMIAVGMTFVIITAGIDLSVGSIVAMAGVIATSFAHPGDSVTLAFLLGALVGLAAGSFNGFIIAKGKVAPFIVTLGMMTMLRGLALVYTNGRPVIDLSDGYGKIGGGYMIGIPNPVIILIIILALGVFTLRFTKYGRHVYAVGGNELAAKVSGINTRAVIFGVYAIVGALSGIAGVVITSRVMTGSPVVGAGYELDAIAAVVIGGTSLAGGVGSILGSFVGALILGVINNGLDLMNVSAYNQQIVKGAIIIFAVLLDRQLHKESK
jgi:ribose/xylose/arabinose/galactoside ABC-type transport system permease subunit